MSPAFVWEKPVAFLDVPESNWGTFLQAWLPKMQSTARIALIGDMGAGKTTFVRELVRALGGSPDQVTSPTFSLQHRYDTPNGFVHHFDLYRVADTPSDRAQLREDIEACPGLVLIEWADRFEEILQDCGMAMRFYFIDLSIRRVYVYA